MFHAHVKGASERSELTPCNIIYMYSGTSDKGHSVLKDTNTK